MHARRKKILQQQESEDEVTEEDDKEAVFNKEAMKGTGKLDIELIDVSASLSLTDRDIYPLVTKPVSKLDLLLQKRQKQYELEQKQVVIIKQVMEKYHKQNKKTATDSVKEEDVDVVGLKGDEKPEEKTDVKEEVKSEIKIENSFSLAGALKKCYSSVCNSGKSVNKCYSTNCLKSSQIKVKSEESESLVNGDDKSGSYQNSFLSFVKNKITPEVKTEATPEIKTEPGTTKQTIEVKNEAKSSTAGAASKPQGVQVTMGGASTNLTAAIANLIQGGKIQLNATIVSDLEKKIANVGKTAACTSLSKFSKKPTATPAVGRPPGKTGAKKSSLPMCQKFLSRHKQHSVLILEKHVLHHLARHAGLIMADGFNYNCKMNNVNWVYPCPRPFFKTVWRYRTQTIKSLATAALQLRILWACVRWDDMQIKSPSGGTNTVTTETEITTKEVVKQRFVGPYNLRSEYLVRTIVIPIGVQQEQRKGMEIMGYTQYY